MTNVNSLQKYNKLKHVTYNSSAVIEFFVFYLRFKQKIYPIPCIIILASISI